MSPLEHSETLVGLAQIWAAFAGFAALVSAVQGRSERLSAKHDLLRLRLVISTSVAGLVIVLVPLGLANFGLSDGMVWHITAIIFLAIDYAVIISFIRSYQPVRGQFQPDSLAVVIVTVLELLKQMTLLVIVLNPVPQFGYSLFFTALLLQLLQAGLVFVRLIGSAFRAAD